MRNWKARTWKYVSCGRGHWSAQRLSSSRPSEARAGTAKDQPLQFDTIPDKASPFRDDGARHGRSAWNRLPPKSGLAQERAKNLPTFISRVRPGRRIERIVVGSASGHAIIPGRTEIRIVGTNGRRAERTRNEAERAANHGSRQIQRRPITRIVLNLRDCRLGGLHGCADESGHGASCRQI